MKAVPPARICASAVGTWVCVPITAETRPSAKWPNAIFSPVASAWISTTIAGHPPPSGAAPAVARGARRVVERLHEQAAHQIDDEQRAAGPARAAGSRRPVCPRGNWPAEDARIARRSWRSARAGPRHGSGRQDVGAGIVELAGNLLGQTVASAAFSALTIATSIESSRAARQMRLDRLAAGPPHHITQRRMFTDSS